MPRKPRLSIDIVIPVFNEVGVVEQTHARLCAVIDSLPYTFTIYYVNDGSTDGTAGSLDSLAEKDGRIQVIELSRNFGHQAALTAGLDVARGDLVITMDCDGQHPPELILEMIQLFQQGYDVIQGQRGDAVAMGTFKKWTSEGFYRILNLISGTRVLPGAADFRAMSRQAVQALKSMPEYHRFLRGMIVWMGYRSVILPYREPERIAGKSKYSLGKMIRLASDAIFSFSLMPLYIGLSAGFTFIILALAQMMYVLVLWLTHQTNRIVPGWSSLMAVLLIASGIIMILLGFIGVYVGYIFQEVKRRPIYLIRRPKSEA
ncbi:MAG TPA: glycosyltransferase family 2 protein [Anaerolineales bacterium]|nr:glycosyltransferase family 2 protein [Anaerolineales bacterium]